MTPSTQKRILFYYALGHDPVYAKLMLASLSSLRQMNDEADFDVLVLCDPALEASVPASARALKHVVRDPCADPSRAPPAMLASMMKICVFDYLDSVPCHGYDYAFCLDTDIICIRPFVAELLAALDATENKDRLLFVKPEYSAEEAAKHHKDYRFSLGTYTDAFVDSLVQRGITPFNCGQFALTLNSSWSRDAFASVRALMASHTGQIFFEQGFMNFYFNSQGVDGALATDQVLLNSFVTLFNADVMSVETSEFAPLVHVYGGGGPLDKLCGMKRIFYLRRADKDDVRILESRDDIATVVGSTRVDTVCEIGVFEGDFSRVLLDKLSPKKLFLIDPWEEGRQVNSGDRDGNGMRFFPDAGKLYDAVVQRFEGDARVIIARDYSQNALPFFGDSSIDVLYIDGDHSYEGCKRDLELAWKLVSNGGYICGHDYEINHEKCKTTYDFGVKRAVDQFCAEHMQRICALFLDGCVSYCIQMKKN